MNITCTNPDGSTNTVQLTSVGGATANDQPNNPTMGAKKLNLSMYDVQQTIKEGRAYWGNRMPIWNISGSTGLGNGVIPGGQNG